MGCHVDSDVSITITGGGYDNMQHVYLCFNILGVNKLHIYVNC